MHSLLLRTQIPSCSFSHRKSLHGIIVYHSFFLIKLNDIFFTSLLPYILVLLIECKTKSKIKRNVFTLLFLSAYPSSCSFLTRCIVATRSPVPTTVGAIQRNTSSFLPFSHPVMVPMRLSCMWTHDMTNRCCFS